MLFTQYLIGRPTHGVLSRCSFVRHAARGRGFLRGRTGLWLIIARRNSKNSGDHVRKGSPPASEKQRPVRSTESDQDSDLLKFLSFRECFLAAETRFSLPAGKWRRRHGSGP